MCLSFFIHHPPTPQVIKKNKHWLEYDQEREAYVRAILARMLGLEMQLNETNQQPHNEDHSDGEPEGQWALGTHNWGNKGRQTVTTRFLRFQDLPSNNPLFYNLRLAMRRRISLFL